MLANKILTVTIFVASTLFVSTVGLTCKGIEIKPEQLENIKECGEKAGITDNASMTPEQMGCVMKCMFDKQLLALDAMGKKNKESALKLIENSVPENLKAQMSSMTAQIMDIKLIKIDPKDTSCSTFAPMASALYAKWLEFCNSDKKAGV